MGPFHRVILLLLIVLSTVSEAVSASEFLPVEEAFKLRVDIENGQVVARWDIAPDYYLYQERLDIKPASEGIELGTPEFTKGGILKNDPTFGEQIVYYDTAELRAKVTGKGHRALDLEVSFQGCADDGLCYPPRTQTVSVQPSSQTTETIAAGVPDASGPGTSATAGGLAGSCKTAVGAGYCSRFLYWAWGSHLPHAYSR